MLLTFQICECHQVAQEESSKAQNFSYDNKVELGSNIYEHINKSNYKIEAPGYKFCMF